MSLPSIPDRPELVEGRPAAERERRPSTSSGRTGERFRAAAASALLTVDLPPFTAVYHRPSGTTHLLVEPAPEILAALAEEPLTLDDLRGRLAANFDLADEAALAARLEELVAAGLVAAA